MHVKNMACDSCREQGSRNSPVFKDPDVQKRM